VDLWNYRDTIGRVDTTGFDVEATDGSIGKVDQATLDVDSSYLVVDTGPWIFGKKVLLPAGAVSHVDRNDETVEVELSKDEIKEAPEYDPDTGFTDAYRDSLSSYYGARTAGKGARHEI